MNVPRAPTFRYGTATSDASKISQNFTSSIYEMIKPQEVLNQELAKNRSGKVLPLNHRNVNEKVLLYLLGLYIVCVDKF